MKKLQALIANPTGGRAVSTPAFMIIVTSLALTFWFASSPSGFAEKDTVKAEPEATCTICHKRTQTLTLTCNSLDYRRHKDHGDPDNACPGTPGSKE